MPCECEGLLARILSLWLRIHAEPSCLMSHWQSGDNLRGKKINTKSQFRASLNNNLRQRLIFPPTCPGTTRAQESTVSNSERDFPLNSRLSISGSTSSGMLAVSWSRQVLSQFEQPINCFVDCPIPGQFKFLKESDY